MNICTVEESVTQKSKYMIHDEHDDEFFELGLKLKFAYRISESKMLKKIYQRVLNTFLLNISASELLYIRAHISK